MTLRPQLSTLVLGLALATVPVAGCAGAGPETPPAPARLDPDAHQGDEELTLEQATTQARAAAVPMHWHDGHRHERLAHVRLLGLNDFHGQITQTKTFTDGAGVRHPVGGIPVLTSWLKAAEADAPAGRDSVLITHAGDFVGASVPESGLLRDEPAIDWFNLLGNHFCRGADAVPAHGFGHGGDDHQRCNLVSTVGNHEFDKGKAELLRKIFGGDAAAGPYLPGHFHGASYPYVSANVVDQRTGKLLLPPYEIEELEGERVAVIGAVTTETPTLVVPTAVAGFTFLDEAAAINKYIPEIHARGVHAIVVLIHQGGSQSFDGAVAPVGTVSGRIVDLVSKLDADVDVVLSGHTHAFTNALLPNAGGRPTLVTQAFSYSTGFAQLDLDIDRHSHDVVAKTGRIVIAYADSGPGLQPDAAAQALLDASVAAAGPTVSAIVGQAAVPLVAGRNGGASFAGETNLGDLITDAQRAAMGTPIALTNPGGIRADVPAGDITWGELYAVQPFANYLVAMDLTGAQLWSALGQQWTGLNAGSGFKILQISGFSYRYTCTADCGSTSAATPPQFAVLSVTDGAGAPIANDDSQVYRVTVNNFLAAGGDNFPAFTGGANTVNGPVDLDALVAWVQAQGTVGAPTAARITRDQ